MKTFFFLFLLLVDFNCVIGNKERISSNKTLLQLNYIKTKCAFLLLFYQSISALQIRKASKFKLWKADLEIETIQRFVLNTDLLTPRLRLSSNKLINLAQKFKLNVQFACGIFTSTSLLEQKCFKMFRILILCTPSQFTLK